MNDENPDRGRGRHGRGILRHGGPFASLIRPSGLTLVEILFVVIIGTMVIMLAVQAQSRLTLMFGSATADIALQTDTRVLFANFSADMTSAILLATGKDKVDAFAWKPEISGQTLQIFRIKSNSKERHLARGSQENPPYPGYPGYREDDEVTEQPLPVFRVVYEVEPDKVATKPRAKIYRTEEEGTLTRREETPVCVKVPVFTYKYQSDRPKRRTLLASNVTRFALVPLAFVPIPPPEPPPTPRPDSAPPEAPKEVDVQLTVWAPDKKCAQLHHIAALGVHFVAEDVKQGSTGGEGRVELVSKFWLEERSAAFRFNRAFSTIDEHL